MNMDISVLTIVGILMTLVYEGAALSCYQCNSNEHADCKETFDHDHMDTITIESTTCSVDAAEYCVKTTGVWGGVVGTTRWCSSRDMGNQCQFIRYPDHDRVYRACIYTCKGHHCNGAISSTVPSTWTLMVLPVIAVIRWLL